MINAELKIIYSKLKSLSEAEREMWEERAAIMEYDGGMDREQAEIRAYKCLFEKKDAEITIKVTGLKKSLT